MKRKSILALVLCALVLAAPLILSGCGNSNTTNNQTASQDADKDSVKDDIENGANDVKDKVKNGATDVKNAADRVGDDIKYTALNFKDDFVNAGYDIRDSLDTHKDYFSGSETDYYVGNDLVRVYEYDTPEAIDEDIALISGDGTIINGNTVDFTTPHYYRNGNSLIVYEGSDEAYINQLNTLYGTAIVPAR